MDDLNDVLSWGNHYIFDSFNIKNLHDMRDALENPETN